MSKYVLITLTSVGSSNGNSFNLFSDVDNYATPFESNVLKSALLTGYTSYIVPDFTTKIKVQSVLGGCGLQPLSGITIAGPTPTPTSTVTPTVTSTPTVTPTVTPTITPTNTITPTVTSTVTPTVTPTATLVPPGPIIQNGLVINVNGTFASYPGTGTTWTSIATGTTYNGDLINGPTWNTATGGYFSFDGVNDYCYFGDSSQGSDSGSRTFGGWVNSTTSSTDKVFYFRGEDGFGGWSLSLYKAGVTNKFACSAVISNGSGTSTVTSTTTLVNNTWYYIVARWTSGTGLSIYVNGTKEATVSHTGTTLRNSDRGWEIARYNGPSYSDVSIGDFELYNRALSDAEVTTNFNTRKSLYGY